MMKKTEEIAEKFIKAIRISICCLVLILIILTVMIIDCEACEANSDNRLACEKISPFTCVDRYREGNGKLARIHDFNNLENGDILLTDSVHTMGIKHGHVGIVVDAENRIVLEAVTYGVPTKERKIDRWSSYANVIHARITDEAARETLENFGITIDNEISPSQQLGNLVAKFAREKVGHVDYSLTYANIRGKAPAVADLQKTQCAHLVWYVYAAFGLDIDANGGRLVTPRDIYKSENIEIVENFGTGVF